jgi:hypothetical protein
MRGLRQSLLALLLALASTGAAAQGLAVQSLELVRQGGEWSARATWSAPWGQEPFRQVKEGVPIDFTVEFRVFRRQGWWLDATVAVVRAQREVYYNRLTRQYRIIDRRLGERYFTREWGRARTMVQRSGTVPVIATDRVAGTGSFYLGVRVKASQEHLSLPARVLNTLTGGWRGVSEWQYRPLAR